MTGMKTSIGPVLVYPMMDLPQPHWNAAVSAPRAAPIERRFMIEATTGIRMLRKTAMSRRKARRTTTATNCGILADRA